MVRPPFRKSLQLALFALACILTIAGCDARSAGVAGSGIEPSRPLALEASLGHDFGQLLGAVALIDDSVLVAVDADPETIFQIDTRRLRATMIGRQGDGPGEFRQVSIPGSVDEACHCFQFYDPASRRVNTWNTDGLALASVPIDAPGQLLTYRASDRDGHGYFSSHAAIPNASGEYPDSASVLRVGAQGEVSKVGAIKIAPLLALQVPPPPGRPGASYRVTVPHPAAPEDLWTVHPEGRIVLLRELGDQIELSTGPGDTWRLPIPFTHVPLGEPERVAARRALGGVDLPQWPTRLPLLRGPLLASPSGRYLMAAIRTSAADSLSRYLWLDAENHRAGVVELPARRRVIGLTANQIFVAARDADGSHRLEIYRSGF